MQSNRREADLEHRRYFISPDIDHFEFDAETQPPARETQTAPLSTPPPIEPTQVQVEPSVTIKVEPSVESIPVKVKSWRRKAKAAAW